VSPKQQKEIVLLKRRKYRITLASENADLSSNTDTTPHTPYINRHTVHAYARLASR